jgi:hypothetical protein
MVWKARKQKLGHDLRDAQLTTAAADYGGLGVSPRRGHHDPRRSRNSAKRQPTDALGSKDRARDSD